MKCKNCSSELTQMKDKDNEPTCLRCLKCHPMPDGNVVIKAKKENVKVDEPWTDARIWKLIEPKVRELFTDLIEDYVIAQNKSTDEPVIDEQPESADSAETIVLDEKIELTWQEEAKALGINPYGRKKEIVLAEIVEKTKTPE